MNNIILNSNTRDWLEAMRIENGCARWVSAAVPSVGTTAVGRSQSDAMCTGML